MRIYAIQASHLRNSLENIMNEKIKVITSNCACYYTSIPAVFTSLFNYKKSLTNSRASFISFPYFQIKKGSSIGYIVRAFYGKMSDPVRGYAFAKATADFDIAHFHQSGEAFGYDSLKYFFKFANKNKKVVTIYRLSPIQKEKPETNNIYNSADAIIVSTEYSKKMLSEFGVKTQKIHVIPYGAMLPSIASKKRDGAIMFAGSPLINVKGFEYLAGALKILKDEGTPLRLKLHGYYMAGHREWAIDIAKKEGIEDLLEWLSFGSEDELIAAYQSSLVCVIPYTDYPGCFPVTVAMANAVPVITTNSMGIPEYINSAGLIVRTKSVEELASALRRIVNEEELRTSLGNKGRLIAEQRFAWPVIAQNVFAVYQEILRN